jgi:drug/metabolite transporter (DMT)-like permease
MPIAPLRAPLKATLLMLGAMACFAAMSLFIRLAAEEVHPLVVVFFRNFLALAFMLPWLMRRGLGGLRTRRLGLFTLRAAINIVGMTAGFTSLTLIPLAEATALSFTAPLFATVLAVLLLAEVIRARRIAALAIGFAGTVIVLRPGVDAVSLGAVLALVNAVTVSVTTIIVKQLTRTERPETIVIYMALLMSPLSLVPALFVWQWPDALTLLWLALLAGAGTAGHLLFTRAFAIAEVSQIQPLEFVRLPLVAALAYLLFGEVPTPWTWLGGSVIFAATAYITHREAQLARRAAAAALHPPPPGA